MIERILPTSAGYFETFGDLPEANLFPPEWGYVRNAVAPRHREFATGRECARRALRAIGFPAVAIRRGERGDPVWPRGAVGSITHCEGYRAAAVADGAVATSIGIDAEPALPLPAGVLDSITAGDEATDLVLLAASRDEVPWDRLLFSAKEAVYKAWFPLTGRVLAFGEVRIALFPGGTFTGLVWPRRAITTSAPRVYRGRWSQGDGFVLTSVLTPRYRGCCSPSTSKGRE
ncbi:MAG TPA: 4'-phosphopantetheinyl transferase superfamily protein [Solirubrobacterales bacterium]